MGGTIGPLGDRSMVRANIAMRGPAVWAASFKRLDAQFMKAAIFEDTGPYPTTLIRLNEDVTSRGHLRSSSDQLAATKQIPWTSDDQDSTEQLLDANAATIQIEDVAELLEGDDEVTSKYWKWFDVAERRILEGISNREMAQAAQATNVS